MGVGMNIFFYIKRKIIWVFSWFVWILKIFNLLKICLNEIILGNLNSVCNWFYRGLCVIVN